MPVPFVAALDPLQDDSAVVPVHRFEMRETVNDGWVANVTVVEDFEVPLSSAGLLGTLLANKVLPGGPVALHLIIAAGDEHAGEAVRIWPSVVTSITPFRLEEDGRAACMVQLRDIVGFHSSRPVWGTYFQRPLGEMFGGMLSSAGFGTGVPSLKPRLWPKLDVSILQHLREELDEVAYTISAGDTLRSWIDRVFGQLGVRYEIVGNEDGSVHIGLHDQAPSTRPIQMDVVDMVGVSEFDRNYETTELTLLDIQFHDIGTDKRAVMMDSFKQGEFRRIGAYGSIGTVITDPNVSVEEAALRAEFLAANDSLQSIRIIATSSQTGLYPCSRIRLAGQTVAADDGWQAIEVIHTFYRSQYHNDLLLIRDFDAWRPPQPDVIPPVLVTGVIDAPDTDAQREVVRDQMGRVPVIFPFLPSLAPEDSTDDLTSSTATWDDSTGGEDGGNDSTNQGDGWQHPRIHLALLEPFAGGKHGMVSAARQGNVCRVAVYNPLFAEIVGFGYRGDLRIGDEYTNISSGMLARHTSPEDPWSGMTFRASRGLPESAVSEDDAEIDADDDGADENETV